jgi:methyl-accepting chemotaxis protein
MLNKMSLLRKLIAAFGAVIFIATAAGIYSYSRLSVVKENSAWTTHTYRVLQSTTKMLSGMVDQETGLRGYLIDGQDKFLDPYRSGAISFQEALKRTLELTADNPAQQARLADLERIATEWKRGHADRAIALASVSATREQGQKLESSGAGKSLFDAFRAKLKDIEDDESALLTVRSEAEADALTNTNLATVLGIVGALLAAAASAFALARSIASPSAALAATMGEITSGKLGTKVPYQDRGDEIGMMAKSLEALRRQAELAEEHRTQAALLQEKGRKDAMEAVVAKVATIVTAASKGDYSARIAVTEADREIRPLLDGINNINATVDSATSDILQLANRLASGDLTSKIEASHQGRFGELTSALNDTVDTLAETVSTIQSTARDVSSAAQEINTGSNDLSSRTEQQASSLEETAATTEELAASVKASAQSSRQAVGLAEQAMTVARDGGAIVGKAVEAMARIESASQKISDITGVIDEIAFQTNLLALNAAVEAARAGDAGKGFAVVASEVRTLAQRSSEAAKEITGLINASVTEVGEGVKLVKSAGDVLGKIVDASQRVTSTVSEISTAADEQANGIDEMSQAVAHMDEMTQQNAALAEESAASASSLTEQIQRLNEVVAQFKVRNQAFASPTVPHRLRQEAAEAFASKRTATARPQSVRKPEAHPKKVAAGGTRTTRWDEF